MEKKKLNLKVRPNGPGVMNMICDIKGCNRHAKYLRVIMLPRGGRLEFSVCEECNKVEWVIEEGIERARHWQGRGRVLREPAP